MNGGNNIPGGNANGTTIPPVWGVAGSNGGYWW